MSTQPAPMDKTRTDTPENDGFACRPGCAACCIAPSISSPLPGMPNGKPAGVPCVNLDENRLCRVWNTPSYPDVCKGFKAEKWVCGENRDQALATLRILEHVTRPGG
jgi:Fe-S-cluster containining protein